METQALTSTRRPRFHRANPPPLQLTSDDLTIMQHVAANRFLRSTHLVRLLKRPPEKVVRRLWALYHNGYLDRPRAQLDHFVRAGSAPFVYALGSRGAPYCALGDTCDASARAWGDKNRTVSRPYIEHALMVADLMIALAEAVRRHPTLALLTPNAIVAAMPAHLRRRHSWTLAATVPGSAAEIAVTPDKVFGLERTATGRRNYFLVEADRATMPIRRRSLAQSSFRKKLLTYHHAHAARRHTDRWGMPGFRVLTITSSRERIASMLDEITDITDGKGSNVFLFADAASLASADPLTLDWITGKGGTVQLGDAGC